MQCISVFMIVCIWYIQVIQELQTLNYCMVYSRKLKFKS